MESAVPFAHKNEETVDDRLESLWSGLTFMQKKAALNMAEHLMMTEETSSQEDQPTPPFAPASTSP